MRKQKTFAKHGDGAYDDAITWLRDLGRCFEIKRAKITNYIKKHKFWDYHCTRVEVTYD